MRSVRSAGTRLHATTPAGRPWRARHLPAGGDCVTAPRIAVFPGRELGPRTDGGVLGLRARRSVTAAIMKVVEHAGLVADLCPSMKFGNPRLPRPTGRPDKSYRFPNPTTNSGNSRLLRVRRIAACKMRDQDYRARGYHRPFHRPHTLIRIVMEAKFADLLVSVEIEHALWSLLACPALRTSTLQRSARRTGRSRSRPCHRCGRRKSILIDSRFHTVRVRI